MGQRGPARAPTATLKLRGSSLVRKGRGDREPQPAKELPRCPSWLDKSSRAAWRVLAPALHECGILTKIDRNPLARYCRFWTRWRRAEDWIEENGSAYPLKDADGKTRRIMTFPQVAIANALALQLTRLEQEFGMTPASRSRLTLEQAELERDPLKEFLASG